MLYDQAQYGNYFLFLVFSYVLSYVLQYHERLWVPRLVQSTLFNVLTTVIVE